MARIIVVAHVLFGPGKEKEQAGDNGGMMLKQSPIETNTAIQKSR